MKKIYLDQKDYSNIAKGLTGVDDYQEDVEIYQELLKKVKASEIRIYFSHGHIIEALRYSLKGSESLDKYSEVVETLTQGHCIRQTNKITELEIQLMLSNEFQFDSSINKVDFVYGKYSDVITIEEDPFKELGKNLRNRFKQHITQTTTGSVKKAHLRKFNKPAQLRSLLLERFNDNAFRILSKEFPVGFTKNDIINIIVKDDNKTASLKQKLPDSLSNFPLLLKHYRKIYPDINKLASVFDSSMIKLEEAINLMQSKWVEHGHEVVFEELKQFFASEVIKQYYSLVLSLSFTHDFNYEHAISFLFKNAYDSIDSYKNFILILMEYIRAHKGELGKAMKPKKSDIVDMRHINYMPYVDILLTDRSARNIYKSIEPEFGTKILRNTKELMDHI